MVGDKKLNRKLNVLLVSNPKVDVGFGRAMKIPSLGLASLAANVDREICDVAVLDLVVCGSRPQEYLRRTIAKLEPDVVGLSSMTFQYTDTLALAETVKQQRPEAMTVLGGYHATTACDEVLADQRAMAVVDVLLRNEGEVAFAALVRALHDGDDWRGLANLAFLRDTTPVVNDSAPILDLSGIRIADRGARLVTRGFHLFGCPADAIETSRGCTQDCDFCSIRRMYGPSYRKYALERILDDMRDARAHGARALFVCDDNVALDGRRYRELCEAIVAEKLQTMFFVQASVQGLYRTDGLIEAMHRSGVRCTFLGIENVSQENLTFLDKHRQFEHDHVAQVVRELRARRIVTIGGFIIGNPEDSEESIRANYEYAKKLGIDVALFFILTPFPGTPIRERLMSMGMVTNPYGYDAYTCFSACVKTNHLSSEELFDLREQLGYRYPLDSGSAWRLIWQAPKSFLLKTFFSELRRSPAEIYGYIREAFSR